jgi:hypothetical protein
MNWFNQDEEEDKKPLFAQTDAQASGADSLEDRYKAAADDADVKAMRDNVNGNDMWINMIRGLGQIATAPSVARGGKGIDDSTFDSLIKQNDAKVTQAEQARKNRMEGVLDTDKLSQLGVDRAFEAKDRAHKEKTMSAADKDAEDNANPMSLKSLARARVMEALNPGQKYVGKYSYNDLNDKTADLAAKKYGDDATSKKLQNRGVWKPNEQKVMTWYPSFQGALPEGPPPSGITSRADLTPDSTAGDIVSTLTPVQKKSYDAIRAKYEGSDPVKRMVNAANAGNHLDHLLKVAENGDPMSSNVIATQEALMKGVVGALAEHSKAGLAEQPGWQAFADRAQQTLDGGGKLSPTDIAYARRMHDQMTKAIHENLDNSKRVAVRDIMATTRLPVAHASKLVQDLYHVNDGAPEPDAPASATSTAPAPTVNDAAPAPEPTEKQKSLLPAYREKYPQKTDAQLLKAMENAGVK